MAKHADAANRQLKGAPAMQDECGRVDEHETDSEDGAEHETDSEDGAEATGGKRFWRVPREIAVSAAIVVALGGFAGWMGYRFYEARQGQDLRDQLVSVARQGALNLTTIDYTSVDADVQRILDSSTGAFHEDFQKRSQPFIDVVRKAQSKSQGTIVAAGLESQDGAQAQVLVLVSVKTSTAGAPEQDPRRWRMRIDVQKIGDSGKVSDVQFVP